jgi:taurine dioxygenase
MSHRTTLPDGITVEARHPLLRRHPLTRETSLFLSTPERCASVDGIDEARSARIIALLYDRSIRPAGLYRHIWYLGDIIIWDNRTTMHRAEHDDVIGDRVLHRGLVAGEIPIPA